MKESVVIEPRALLRRLAAELPVDLVAQVFVIGSLAAACHHTSRLVGGGVRTKDADLVVYPADNSGGAQGIARRLRALGWRHRDLSPFQPGTADTPANQLPAIRLYPPEHDDYFVELLIVPAGEHPGAKPWLQVELDDGWYGLPSFEFLALTLFERESLPGGLAYAHPSMMALANLLSHRTLTPHRMSSPVGGRTVERHAKDLGRVLALAHLESRAEVELWGARWVAALQITFPTRWPTLACGVGDGLRALLDSPAFDEALHCCQVGLLAGQGVSGLNLRATAARLLVGAVAQVEDEGKQSAPP